MTDQEQRIAIAKWMGWTSTTYRKEGLAKCDDFLWKSPGGTMYDDYGDGTALPDYIHDLNAMHEAEENLRNNQFWIVDYPDQIFKIVTGLKWKGEMGYFFPMVIHATASQRAEALLRTLGLWKENDVPRSGP